MGRIEDALRHATENRGSDLSDSGSTHESSSATFVSPWDADAPGERPSLAKMPVTLPAGIKDGLRSRQKRGESPSLRLESQLAMGWPQPFAADVAGKLVVFREVDRQALAQYDRLAKTLEKAKTDRGVRSVLVASAVEGEGRTLTAVNLALTLSRSGGGVLLMDADFHNPRIHQIFQVSAGTGLTGCLMSTGDLSLPVIHVMEGLTLLPAGMARAEFTLLGSEQMRKVLAEATQKFDWVLIDGAPIVVVPDAAPLATLVDTVLLVVEAGRTSQGEVAQAVDAIGQDRLMGIVLNRTSHKAVEQDATESGGLSPDHVA
jgi:capsular exopolysaccharide synthesis family protein